MILKIAPDAGKRKLDRNVVAGEFILRSALQDQVLKEGTLLGSLRLLYPLEGGADAGCQAKVAAFLEEMFAAGGAYADATAALLDQFAHNHAAQFEASPLRALRAKITEQQ